MTDSITSFLNASLKDSLSPDEFAWLTDEQDKLLAAEEKQLYKSIALVPRKIKRQALSLDLNAAEQTLTDWTPENWYSDEAARIFLLISFPVDETELFAILERFFISADLKEGECYYKGLCLYPGPEQYNKRAAEGLRTNVQDIFNAVAINNPYPAAHLDEGAWNQMILKAIFIGTPLYKIAKLESRTNDELSRMLCDYANERRAASRSIPAELWRAVGPSNTDLAVENLAIALDSQDELEGQAAALALSTSPHTDAAGILSGYSDLIDGLNASNVTWLEIGRKAEEL